MLQQFTVDHSQPVRQVNAEGRFLQVTSSTGIVGTEGLAVRVDGQALGTFLPGDSVEVPNGGKVWDLSPTSTGGTYTVRIGYAKVTTARTVNTGSVSVADNLQALSGSTQAFFGAATVAQSTGLFAGFFLQNNHASRVLNVRSWRVAVQASDLAIGWRLGIGVSAPNAYTAQTSGATNGGAPGGGILHRAENAAGVLWVPTRVLSHYGYLPMQAINAPPLELIRAGLPLRVAPGSWAGFFCQGAQTASAVVGAVCDVAWTEE